MKKELEDFCEEIIKRRKMVGLTQEEVSLFLGLSRATLTNIEKGRQYPSLLTGVRLMKLLGFDVRDYIQVDVDISHLKKLKIKKYKAKIKELQEQPDE